MNAIFGPLLNLSMVLIINTIQMHGGYPKYYKKEWYKEALFFPRKHAKSRHNFDEIC